MHVETRPSSVATPLSVHGGLLVLVLGLRDLVRSQSNTLVALSLGTISRRSLFPITRRRQILSKDPERHDAIRQLRVTLIRKLTSSPAYQSVATSTSWPSRSEGTWAAASWRQYGRMAWSTCHSPATSQITLCELGNHVSKICLVHPLLGAVLEPLNLTYELFVESHRRLPRTGGYISDRKTLRSARSA